MSCFPVILFCRVYKNISDAGTHCGKTAGSFWRIIHDYKNVAKTKNKNITRINTRTVETNHSQSNSRNKTAELLFRVYCVLLDRQRIKMP